MISNFHVRRAESGVTVVALTGQLTQGKTVTEIEYKVEELIREGTRRIVFDLSELAFIDSSGIGMMITCAGVMTKQHGKVVIAGATGKVNQILEITQLHRLIGIHADLAAAVASFDETHPPAPVK